MIDSAIFATPTLCSETIDMSVNTLPPEILAKIFQVGANVSDSWETYILATDAGNKVSKPVLKSFARTPSQVCRLWRNLILHDTSLYLLRFLFRGCKSLFRKEDLENARQASEAFLACDIQLDIEFKRNLGRISPDTSVEADELENLITSWSSRLRAFTLRRSSPAVDRIFPILRALRSIRLPQLDYFELSSARATSPAPQDETAILPATTVPNLAVLTIMDSYWGYGSPFSHRLSCLSLNITPLFSGGAEQQPTWDSIFGILRECSLLERFYMSWAEPSSLNETFPITNTIPLPRLREFGIACPLHEISTFISMLTLPVLVHLDLQVKRSSMLSDMKEISSYFNFPTLRTMRISTLILSTIQFLNLSRLPALTDLIVAIRVKEFYDPYFIQGPSSLQLPSISRIDVDSPLEAVNFLISALSMRPEQRLNSLVLDTGSRDGAGEHSLIKALSGPLFSNLRTLAIRNFNSPSLTLVNLYKELPSIERLELTLWEKSPTFYFPSLSSMEIEGVILPRLKALVLYTDGSWFSQFQSKYDHPYRYFEAMTNFVVDHGKKCGRLLSLLTLDCALEGRYQARIRQAVEKFVEGAKRPLLAKIPNFPSSV